MLTLTKSATSVHRFVHKWTLTSVSSRCLTNTKNESWDLFSAVCIERSPHIAPPLNSLEKAVKQSLEQLELARSLKSDHEIRLIRDQERADRLASGQKTSTEEDNPDTAIQTAQDFEEKSYRELKQYEQFASDNMITFDDSNQKSLNRLLDQHLILFCNQKLGQKFSWRLPQQKVHENESLRQAADRCFELFEQTSIQAKVLGNCPMAVLKYKYPKPVADQLKSIGKQIYFFKAHYISGEIQQEQLDSNLITDFRWLNREEARTILKRKYAQALSSGLLIEGPSKNTLNRVLLRMQRKANQFEKQIKKESIAQ